jgi:hypothetical protein
MDKYDELVQKGYDFNLSHYLNEGWNVFGRSAGHLILMSIILFLFSIVIILIPLIGILSYPFLIGAFVAGFYGYLHHKETTREGDFSKMFSGFNEAGSIFGFQGLLFVIYLLLFIISFFIILPEELLDKVTSGEIANFYYEREATLRDMIFSVFFMVSSYTYG